MKELPEYIEDVPNISGAEDQVIETMRNGAAKQLYREAGRIDFGSIRAASAIALHMHQPLIPAGCDNQDIDSICINSGAKTRLT